MACSSVPVLASETPTEPVEANSVTPPGDAQIREGLEEAERRERERLRELQTPELTRQREESRTAFAGFSDSAARELLLGVFSKEIAALNADPARYLSDVKLVRTYGGSAATVSDEGDGSLLEAGIPVRTEDTEGDLSKVDLGLEGTEAGFEPANPLVELQIPEQADEAIEIGEEGLAISPAGVEEVAAQSLGEKNVWFPDVQEDTDMLVSPISSGVEIFDQLRSPASPETLRFHLDLPEGARLQKNGAGGADISQGGQVIAVVAPPSAVDAQGTHVPIDLDLDGQSIVLDVPHRGGDFAYPILVDPVIGEWNENAWFFGYALENLASSIWGYSTTDPGGSYTAHNSYCVTTQLCSPSGRGLFISTMNRNIPPNTWGQYYYSVPGSTTYIPSIYPEPSAYLNPFWRNNEGCSWNSYNQPHDYDGAYDASGNWVYLETDRAQWSGSATIVTKAKGIAFGMSTANNWVNIPCWRDIMLGGAVIRLDDPENPTLSSVTGVPTGWVSDTTQFTITANASDPGLGVQNGTMYPKDNVIRYFTPPQNQCPGTKPHPCPASPDYQIAANGTLFDEGEKTVDFSVYDPTGKTSNTVQETIRVDRTPPEVTLAGQLAIATEEDEGDAQDPEKWDQLRLPVYNLKIEATDGPTVPDPEPKDKRSGVKSIAIFLDGKETPEQSWEQPCPASSCAMTQSYQLQVSGLGMGKHTLEVKAKDQVGKERVRKIEFEYFPATGMKDDYVMQRFPLEDGQGADDGEEGDGPELAVNVMNGNLVYREQDIDVEGSAAVDLEVERYYNSQLPDSENTEWGDGWTLAEAPTLDPEDTGGTSAPDQAEMVDSTGAIEEGVGLPESTDDERFADQLQATLTKTADGYELRDETGEETNVVAFDENGRTDELQAGEYVGVDYDYEGGDLSEIAVDDPGSAGGATEVESPDPPAYNPRYSSAFGSKGSGNGQLSAPGDVVRDPNTGNLLVVDTANNRIVKFNAKGEFLANIGSYGSGDGQFKRPTAIALTTPSSYLLVADSGNNRIQKFTPEGVFYRKFGTKGTGNGQFGGAGPEGIAFGPEGNIWVADTYNGRLQRFTSPGDFVETVASKGSGEGQLGEPTGIDFGPEGHLWVADAQNNRVSVFRPDGEAGADGLGRFVRQFGTAGSEEGQFNRPSTVEVDDQGNVWVGDPNNSRIQRFDLNGEYRTEFGSKGSGPGQFNLAYPMGIASNPTGTLWVTDVGNNRIEKWQIPAEVPAYSRSFGSGGTGDGQVQSPGDVAVDADGNLWVVDKGNNRIEKFNSKGEYVSKSGSYGTGNGQFNRPTAIAIDSLGNLWVTDAGNNRVQKFGPSGAFLAKYGSLGSGNTQFNTPEGIAIDNVGNVWVADKLNGRLQRLSPSGSFLGAVGTKGSGSGQLGEPTGVDVGPENYVWVTDWQNNRVSVFSQSNEGTGIQFLRQFGTAGAGDGQFNRPDAIDVDAAGSVWVGDQNNGRVELFNRNGEYLAQFGAEGSGEGQFDFSYPFGIATDDAGGMWITDPDNNRVQEWLISSRVRIEDDPSVDVSTSGGLVESVEGEEAGEHSYDHEGEMLTSHDGPQGETQYSYTSAGRLAGIVLPNGTSAEIAYKGGYGRVSSVTVDRAGEEPARTTYFEYTDEPRRTFVEVPGAPNITYDIGEDGSVLKWWNTAQPPSFDDLSGSLYFDREKPEPISIGDHNLVAQAHSEEGIASIQVIANGNVLVDELECDKPHVSECKTLVNEWVTETGAHAPGILNLEVIATDGDEHTESRRFWVNIPYTPPDPPGALVPPKFKDIKQFREEYGLEVVFPVANELELNDRIFDLIGAWHNPQTPAGEVARASWERWGVPLRAVDVAELEYRERSLAHNGPLISAWGESNFSSAYAGYYMDHRAGGKIRIGFTSNPVSSVESLKQQPDVMAGDRLTPFETTPARSLITLRGARQDFRERIAVRPDLSSFLTSGSIDVKENIVKIGATDTSSIDGFLVQNYGTPNAFRTVFEASKGTLRVKTCVEEGAYAREPNGRLYSGDWIRHNLADCGCTLNFGAWEEKAPKPDGTPVFARYALTAGHCYAIGERVVRGTPDKAGEETLGSPFGTVERRSNGLDGGGGFQTDAEAMRLDRGTELPKWIQWSGGGTQTMVNGAADWNPGQTVCLSGAYGGARCGVSKSYVKEIWYVGAPFPTWQIVVEAYSECGDSGSPIWDPVTNHAIGILTGGPSCSSSPTWVTPLLPMEGKDYAKGIIEPGQSPGALAAPSMNYPSPLNIVDPVP